MQTLYLKNTYDGGDVYYKIERIANPADEYMYEGTEIVLEDDLITRDEYEFTEEDLQEMYRDGFKPVSAAEYQAAEQKHESLDL